MEIKILKHFAVITGLLLSAGCAHKTPDNFNCGFKNGETKGRNEAFQKLRYSPEWIDRCPLDMSEDTKKGYREGYLNGLDSAGDGHASPKQFVCYKTTGKKDLLVYGKTLDGARKKWGIICPESNNETECRSYVTCNSRY